jgi:hypothetical protein
VANYGLRFELNIPDTNKTVTISSKEGSSKPYLRVVYTVDTNPGPIIKAAATEYLTTHDEPKLLYKVRAVDLSEVVVGTWSTETISIGDTLRIYDSEMDLNVDVRVVKITKDLLNPESLELELANKAYSISDVQAKVAKQLAYAMPYKDNTKIVSANAVQTGYLGSDVG